MHSAALYSIASRGRGAIVGRLLCTGADRQDTAIQGLKVLLVLYKICSRCSMRARLHAQLACRNLLLRVIAPACSTAWRRRAHSQTRTMQTGARTVRRAAIALACTCRRCNIVMPQRVRPTPTLVPQDHTHRVPLCPTSSIYSHGMVRALVKQS